MNCKQVEELLPLLVSRDLEAGRERLVTAHVESCAACSVAAGEYRQSRQLLQEFVPPAFSDDVYAGIRQNVWRRIESESSRQSQWQVITSWFQPRLAWASATVVLFAASVFGIYLMANRSSVSPGAAATLPGMNRNAQDKEPSQLLKDGARVPASTTNEISKGQRLAGLRTTQRRIHRNGISVRAESVAVARSGPSLPVDTSSRVNTFPQSDADVNKNSENTLRMEIQTKNPNIRIIWFSQRERKPAAPNSKGI